MDIFGSMCFEKMQKKKEIDFFKPDYQNTPLKAVTNIGKMVMAVRCIINFLRRFNSARSASSLIISFRGSSARYRSRKIGSVNTLDFPQRDALNSLDFLFSLLCEITRRSQSLSRCVTAQMEFTFRVITAPTFGYKLPPHRVPDRSKSYKNSLAIFADRVFHSRIFGLTFWLHGKHITYSRD